MNRESGIVLKLGTPLATGVCMSLSAEQLNQMTLAEILSALGLPMRLLKGDVDHEETTAVMDAVAAENWRNSDVVMEAA